jgi:hypothetical protein
MSMLNNTFTMPLQNISTLPPNTIAPLQNTKTLPPNTIAPLQNTKIFSPNTIASSQYMSKYDDEQLQDKTQIEISCKDSTGKYIYLIFHIIMSFVAIFLSWKCNNGKFNLLTFLIALFFPYIYIVYILATRGTCDKI